MKSCGLFLFCENRTELKRTDRDTGQSGDGTGVLFSCLCTAGIVPHRERKQQESRRKIPPGKNRKRRMN